MHKNEFIFIQENYFGLYDGINCMDYSFPYWKGTDFYKTSFKYLEDFQKQNLKPPQSMHHGLPFITNGKSMSFFDYTKKKESLEKIAIYPLSIYASAENAFFDFETIVLNKLHYKVVNELKTNPNFFLLINYSYEGFISFCEYDNIHKWLDENKIDYSKCYFTVSNYRLWEYEQEYRKKYNKQKSICISPYMWSVPFFNNKLVCGGFKGETLNKQNYFRKKHDFNLLIREQKPHRTRLLVDLESKNLLDNNLVSYDLWLNDNYSEEIYYNRWENIIDKESEKFKNYWEGLKNLSIKQSKRTIDYDDLESVKGVDMETDIPYKDSLFTIVAESFFNEEEPIGYISEKVIKPIIHKHPFILLSTSDSLTYLKSIGFKTFGDTGFIDESYDAERNDEKRYYMVLKQICDLCNLSVEQKDSFIYNCKNIIEHNFNHLKKFNIKELENNFENQFYKIKYQNVKTLF